MAKNKHTFAKRQRELEKKRKADEKRAKRHGLTPSDSDQNSELNPSDGNPAETTTAEASTTPPQVT